MADAKDLKGDAEKLETTNMATIDLHDGMGEKGAAGNVAVAAVADADALAQAYEGETREHEMSTWEALKLHPKACFWAVIFCFTIVMEAFDMFLMNNFVALDAFKERYGVTLPDGSKTITTKWQSALFQAGQCGAFVGVFIAGPLTNRLGYRWACITALIFLTCTIFICFFAESLSVMTVGQFFEGIPWGVFIAISPAYASEVVPISLRGVVTASLQMAWSVGGIIVSATTYSTNKRTDASAWRLPLALQWIFPPPLLLLILFAPESPYWLVRKGRREEALRSVRRLGQKSAKTDQDTLAMIERTVEIEAKMGGNPSLLDLFKGVDLRRTLIICFMYASQNLAGNLIANQAVFFFEQAGMSVDFAFKLGLINNCLSFVANAGSWFLTVWFGRRTIYLWGTATNTILLMILGVCASISQSSSTNYAQAVLGVLITIVFCATLGPITFAVISETSAVRLRALSTSVGRGAYYVVEIPTIYLASRMLNPTGWNLAGKCGYVWGGTATVCGVIAYFFLPELKGRSYREVDILFNRKVPARQFKTTTVEIGDDE